MTAGLDSQNRTELNRTKTVGWGSWDCGNRGTWTQSLPGDVCWHGNVDDMKHRRAGQTLSLWGCVQTEETHQHAWQGGGQKGGGDLDWFSWPGRMKPLCRNPDHPNPPTRSYNQTRARSKMGIILFNSNLGLLIYIIRFSRQIIFRCFTGLHGPLL